MKLTEKEINTNKKNDLFPSEINYLLQPKARNNFIINNTNLPNTERNFSQITKIDKSEILNGSTRNKKNISINFDIHSNAEKLNLDIGFKKLKRDSSIITRQKNDKFGLKNLNYKIRDEETFLDTEAEDEFYNNQDKINHQKKMENLEFAIETKKGKILFYCF